MIRRPEGTVVRAALAAAVALTLGCLRVERRRLTDRLLSTPDVWRRVWFSDWKREAALIAIAGGLLLALALTWTWTRVRSGNGRLARISALGSGAALGLAGGALMAWGSGFLRWGGGYWLGCWEPQVREHTVYDWLVSGAWPFEAARAAIVGVAFLSSAAAVRLASRAEAVNGPRSRLIPTAIFAIGFAAFVLTRGEAADAQSPMRRVLIAERLWGFGPGQVAELPVTASCGPLEDAGLVVSRDREGWSVGGVHVDSDGALRDALVAHQALWSNIHRSVSLQAEVDLAIPTTERMPIVQPVLDALRAADFAKVVALASYATPPWRSRTLGDVGYVPRACSVRLPEARASGGAGTWGELVSGAR